MDDNDPYQFLPYHDPCDPGGKEVGGAFCIEWVQFLLKKEKFRTEIKFNLTKT